MAPQSLWPNIPAIFAYFLSSGPLLPNKKHPAPGNQVWSLHNMARIHSETHFKLSPRIRYHVQRAHGTAKATTSFSSGCNCDIYGYQGNREHKWSTLPYIWPIILTYLEIFQCNQTEYIITSWWPTTMMQTLFLQHYSKIEQEPTS